MHALDMPGDPDDPVGRLQALDIPGEPDSVVTRPIDVTETLVANGLTAAPLEWDADRVVTAIYSEHYRSLVAQSQLLPLVDRAVKGLDVLWLVRFLARIGKWYLDTETDPAVGRIMRSLLSSGLGGLGLIRIQEVRNG